MLDKKVSKAMWKKSIYNAEMESILTRVSCGAARSRKSVSEVSGGENRWRVFQLGAGSGTGPHPAKVQHIPDVYQGLSRTHLAG